MAGDDDLTCGHQNRERLRTKLSDRPLVRAHGCTIRRGVTAAAAGYDLFMRATEAGLTSFP